MTIHTEWKKKFDEKFVEQQADGEWWQTDYDYPETATPEKVKTFISEYTKALIESLRMERGLGGETNYQNGYNQAVTEQNKKLDEILEELG